MSRPEFIGGDGVKRDLREHLEYLGRLARVWEDRARHATTPKLVEDARQQAEHVRQIATRLRAERGARESIVIDAGREDLATNITAALQRQFPNDTYYADGTSVLSSVLDPTSLDLRRVFALGYRACLIDTNRR